VKPEILIFPDAAAAIEAHARQLVGQIAGLAATRGRVRLVLSGGSTPRPLYERLAREDLARAVPWPQVDVLLGDERHVPADHEHSNQRQARETLLDHLSEAPARFIAVDAKREHMDAARDFARRLGTEPVDVVLLGIGDDGHTASLFPGGAGPCTHRAATPDQFVPGGPESREPCDLSRARRQKIGDPGSRPRGLRTSLGRCSPARRAGAPIERPRADLHGPGGLGPAAVMPGVSARLMRYSLPSVTRKRLPR